MGIRPQSSPCSPHPSFPPPLTTSFLSICYLPPHCRPPTLFPLFHSLHKSLIMSVLKKQNKKKHRDKRERKGGIRWRWKKEKSKSKCCDGPMRRGLRKGQPVCDYAQIVQPSWHANTYTHTHTSPHAQTFPSCGDLEKMMEFRVESVMHSHIFYVSVICRILHSNSNTHSVTP